MNKMATWLNVFGGFFIVAGIGFGIYAAQSTYIPESVWKTDYMRALNGEPVSHTTFSFTIFLSYAFAGIASGLFFLGLGEVIRLLDRIARRPSDHTAK